MRFNYKNHRKCVLMYNSKFFKFVFCYLHLFERKKGRKVYKFLNFSLWAVYPTMITHHEQCIFIIYDSTDREKKQLSKKLNLTKVEFISRT